MIDLYRYVFLSLTPTEPPTPIGVMSMFSWLSHSFLKSTSALDHHGTVGLLVLSTRNHAFNFTFIFNFFKQKYRIFSYQTMYRYIRQSIHQRHCWDSNSSAVHRHRSI